MGFKEWSNKKKKKEEEEGFREWSNRKYGTNTDIAPVRSDDDIAPVKSTKKEESDQPLLVQAFNKFGEFTEDLADGIGKIILGETDKKEKKEDTEIAPTVSTAKDEGGKFNLKDAASWAGNAAMSGLASFNKGITSTADVLLGKPLESLGWENNPISKMADYYDDQYTAWKNETAEDAAKLGGGKGLSVAGDLVEGVVAAVPNALTALMTGGASIGTSMTSAGLQQAAVYQSGNLLTKVGVTASNMVKNPQYWTSFVQTMGNDYEEAKARGASDTAALYGATISSLLNAGVEIGIDGMSGIQGLPAKIMGGDKNAFFEWVESSLSEGGEEMVQGVISNIVSKVMYDEDTKVFDGKEMLTDAAMGTAIGGILGGGQIAAVKGADAVNNAIQTHEDNKLTENEQKVVERVLEDRIAEAEKGGEKLTDKDKNKIYEEVERDLEKGYIPTDTIEAVLGGETYTEYKNTTDSEDALRKEFDELGAMKKSDFTVKQDDRYNELKQKLAEIDGGDARNQLKSKLSGEVMSLVEGSRLSESYNERTRRGEKFNADLTAYNEKQKAVVQKAIDSGILNNTNRTHEFVDMVAKISADKGVLFDFTNNAKLKDSGFALDGKTVNGFVNQDGVTVNIDSAKSLNSVVGHEITHVLEGTELYNELHNAVVEYAKTKGDYQGRYDSLAALYKGVEGADIDAELTADLIGDYLFTDADFVNHLTVTNRNVFQKIYDEVKYLYKVATAGSKEAREIERVKRAFDKAYKSGGAVADTKYSLTPEQQEHFKDSKVRDEDGNLKVMYHGTSKGGHTVFDTYGSQYGLFGQGSYFTDNKDVAQSYTKKGKGNAPQVYETYLNIKNPMDMDAQADAAAWGKAFPDATFPESGTNEDFYRAMEEYFTDEQMPKWDAAEEAMESIMGMGYDGITHIGGGRADADGVKHRVYITFDPEQIKNIDNAKPTDSADIRYSLSRNSELMQNAETANSENLAIDLGMAKQQRQEIYEYMVKNADRLKLPEDIEGNTAIKNSSYDITEENTTVCIRSMAADALCDAVAEELGRPLTVQDTLRISQDLMNYTDEPECVYCYVATDRKAYREFLGSYYNQMQNAIEEIRNGKNAEEVYKAFLNGRKDTKNMRNRFKMWKRIANGGKTISAKDLASEKMMQNAMRDPELSAQVKDARAYAQSASWAKKRTGYQAYNGHILDWSQRRVNDLNKHYGLRFYSFSDFSPAFVLENMQQMTDAAVRGLKGLAYTKVLDFAEIFAPTGININISVFGYDQNGMVAQDGMMGADWKGAQDLRNRYENVGITFVATNDAQIEWALGQEWIDVVIPYHLVRTGQAVAKHFGYTNYTAESGDTKGANWKKGDKKTIYPAEHNNDKQTYLAALAEANLEPRFARWVSHPNYMKLVNETRRSANDTPPMQAVFNVDAAKDSLDRMMKRGGYFVPIGGDYGNMHDIASEIADSIREGTSHSLSAEGETLKAHGRYNVRGEDVALETAPAQDDAQDIAPVPETEKVVEEAAPKERRLAWYNRYGEKVDDVPVMEDTEPSDPSLPQLREELADIEQRAKDAYAAGDVDTLTDIGERHAEITAKIEQMEAEESERAASLDDADAPPEMDAPYQNDGDAPADPFADRDIKDIGDRKVNAYMYENPEVKPYFQAEANILLGELDRTDKAQTYYNGWIKQDMPFEFAQDIPEVYRTSRVTSPSIAALRDQYGMSYDDIRKGLNALIEDHGAENIAAAKKIEFEINDRLMKGYQDDMGNDVPANAEYMNLLNEKQIEAYSEEARRSFFESVGAVDIAPVAEKYEAIKPKKQAKEPSMKRVKDDDIAPIADARKSGKIAKVMVGEPDVPQKKVSGWQKFRTNFLDKLSVFEDLALKTKNRELMGKANFMLSSESRAQHMIGKGTNGVKSLNDIRAQVGETGNTEAFYNYMYHLHNVDRMSLEDKAKPVVEGLYSKFNNLRNDQIRAIAAKKITDKTTEKTAQTIRDAQEYLKAIDAKNKPVFGDEVTADVSREMVSDYEKAHPEFKAWAQDVYTYMNHLRGLMVQNGVISQETADLWSEMYPHYVPIRRDGKNGAAVNVPLDTGRTGVNAPIKRAVGGNSDIMDMFDTMAMRTEQTYRAIAKNSFGVELKNTLGTTLEKSKASLDEVIDSIDTHEELLKKGENGANPTFTVFENGERVEFEITDAMYDALKPTSEGLKYVNPVANAISKVHKGILTEYNPVFSLTNAIKDAQDILINSRHAAKTYANVPNALWQMAKGGKWYNEYIENGGEQNTYFDNQKSAFKAEDKTWKKVLGLPLRGISYLNNTIERVPRLAEYIASRKGGESVEVAMLDAARVTTNFSAGGDVARFADRNGATFLNASIQGFNQQVRNVREAKANGLKGWLQLTAKTAIAGIPALILNDLLWDDDEEYEELSDYVKDNYYIVAKFGDGKFVRIPKGRTMAVIQDAFEQMKNALTGDDEVDLGNFLDLALTNLAPNNPIDNNIISPVVQAVSNRAWYGDDIVPTRLQDMPSAEQYDESTDSISKWLGEHTNTSPMKWNYVLNQYGGGLADMSLPYLTPEAESGGNKLIAPLRDKFTTDSVMNNQNVSDFYDTMDELTKNANSAYATDEDILKSKYMNSVNSELSALYQQKREIQNSNLSDAKKYAAVREVQKQIDSMTAEGLNTYGDVKIDGVYATVGDRHYHVNKEGAWEKITDKQLEKQNEVTSGLGISASAYWSDKDEYDFKYEYPEKYDFFRKNGITYDDYANADEDGKRAYTWAAENPEKYELSKAVTGDLFEYRRYTGELYDIKADKDEDGKSISGSRKEKVIEYLNDLDADYYAKIILFKSEYNADDTYNQEIVEYLNGREDISYKQMETILKELGFEVDSDGNISW